MRHSITLFIRFELARKVALVPLARDWRNLPIIRNLFFDESAEEVEADPMATARSLFALIEIDLYEQFWVFVRRMMGTDITVLMEEPTSSANYTYDALLKLYDIAGYAVCRRLHDLLHSHEDSANLSFYREYLESSHYASSHEAGAAGLPIDSLVFREQKGRLYYVTLSVFDFIKYINHVFVKMLHTPLVGS